MKILVRTITTKKNPFDYTYFEDEFRSEFNTNIRQDIIRDYEKTVEGWRNKPYFRTRLRITQDEVSFFVWPAGPHADQYNLVDAGSPEHVITPKAIGGRLRYRTGYSPSTRPRVISSRRSSRYGPLVTARAVSHPGFEGREFHKTISKEYYPDYRRRIKNALQRATYKIRRDQGTF